MTDTVKTKTATADLLQSVYKNVKMASDSILNVMPKIKNEKLKHEMTVQLSTFDAFASRTAKLLAKEGVKPTEEGTVTKLTSKWGTMVNTMIDSTASHIAEMMIEGATMGVNDMIKQLREAENGTASEDSLQLARDVCAFEERIVEEMKAYLR